MACRSGSTPTTSSPPRTDQVKTCTMEDCTRQVRVQSRGLCNGCYQRAARLGALRPLPDTTHDRLWSKVKQDGDCWVWTGYKDPSGYGRLGFRDSVWLAHRVSYTLMIEEIPDGLQLDHLCRNRACVNPYHLEPVPPEVNRLRGNINQNVGKTHCKHGHPLDGENLYTNPDGCRHCRECQRRRKREHREARRANVQGE